MNYSAAANEHYDLLSKADIDSLRICPQIGDQNFRVIVFPFCEFGSRKISLE